MNKNKIKPFVKWAGGKSQLLPIISSLIPKKYNTYIEPFVGGGALFFHLQSKVAIINDINSELITTYKVVKDYLPNFLISLNEILQNHLVAEDKKIFYNSIRSNEKKKNEIYQATRFVYLNKTSFNGLYRVNVLGKFNVPFNNQNILKQASLYDENNLKLISFYLNNANIKIYNEDFENIINLANKDDFIFVDPPYDSDTKIFDAYDKDKFLKENQKRLALALFKAHKKGVKWILTNHDTLLIRELYKDFNFKKVVVNRQINSKANKRSQSADEIIIYNYSLDLEQEKESNLKIFFKQLVPSYSKQFNNYINPNDMIKLVEKIKISCFILNQLLSSDIINFEIKFKNLLKENIKVFEILPMIKSKILKDEDTFYYFTNEKFQTTFDLNDFNSINIFMNQSGLVSSLFLNPKVKDIYSYLFEIEKDINVFNIKKNKTDLWMGNQIANILKRHNIKFEQKVNIKFLEDIVKNKNIKFDYVFKINEFEYYLKYNFFNVNHSKINIEYEWFIELNSAFKKYNDKKFIWIIDGRGLIKYQSQVEKIFIQTNHLYNLYTFENFLISITKNL